MIGFKLVEG
ncbi:hypothetical protein VCHC17A1_2521A, partial [Vibrio cholerae HC-17A1]